MTMEKVLPLLYHYKSKAQYNITTSHHQTANFFGVEWQLYSTRITMLKWTNRQGNIFIVNLFIRSTAQYGLFCLRNVSSYSWSFKILFSQDLNFDKIWNVGIWRVIWNVEIALRYVILSDKRVLGCCQIRLLFALHKCKTVCI